VLEMGLAYKTNLVGGDFMLPTYVGDVVAMDPGRLMRWGPVGEEPYHLFIAPRPHQARWVERARRQLALEAPGYIVTVAFVVPRDAVPGTLNEGALRRMLPAAACILDHPELTVTLLAVGERPPLLRVPAGGSKQLPPPQWDRAFLPVDRVCTLLQFQRRGAGGRVFGARWVRGQPPQPGASELEML